MLEIRVVWPLSDDERAFLQLLIGERNRREGSDPARTTGAPGPSPAAEAGASRESVLRTTPQVLPSAPPAVVPAAAMPKFRRDQHKSYRTAARTAALVAAWDGPETMAVVVARLNALPGPVVPQGAGAIYRWAAAEGLGQRPNRPAPAGRAAAGADRQPTWRTEAREALLRELWTQVLPQREIQARLNGLPGPALPDDPGNVALWGRLLKLEGRPGREIQALVNRRGDGVAAPSGPKRSQAEAVTATNQARGVALVRERIEAAVPVAVEVVAPVLVAPAPAPVPPVLAPDVPRAVPVLPEPIDGAVYASFREIQVWAGYFGVGYDGSNMDRVNKLRAAKGLPRLVQDEARAA